MRQLLTGECDKGKKVKEEGDYRVREDGSVDRERTDGRRPIKSMVFGNHVEQRVGCHTARERDK